MVISVIMVDLLSGAGGLMLGLILVAWPTDLHQEVLFFIVQLLMGLVSFESPQMSVFVRR